MKNNKAECLQTTYIIFSGWSVTIINLGYFWSTKIKQLYQTMLIKIDVTRQIW